MARPKRLGFRKKSIPMTALLTRRGAFAAGSATFLAVHDSVVPEDATVQGITDWRCPPLQAAA